MNQLSSRERVVRILKHMEPDRVACDLTITITPYMELCEYLGIKETLWWDDWCHAFPSPQVLEKLNVDVYHVPLRLAYHNHTEFETHMEKYVDEWGISKKKVPNESGSFMYQMLDHPLAEAGSVEEIINYPWPELNEDCLHDIEKDVRTLYKETDFALTATFGGNVWERSYFLRGMEKYMIDMMINPQIANAIMESVLKVQMKVDEAVFKAIGKYLTYMRFNGEDLGSQSGPLVSVELFRKMIRPKLETEWRAAKKLFQSVNPDGKISIHSCGAITKFIPDFIEMGADILNPLQPNAAGMDTALIKKEFGDKLSFHGAVDSQDVIAQGTIEDIRKEVKKRITDLAPGGGYILSPSHNIQAGVNPEKVVALYEAVKEFGKYPISI
jgi:uroporphyrinogen decarboxylase